MSDRTKKILDLCKSAESTNFNEEDIQLSQQSIEDKDLCAVKENTNSNEDVTNSQQPLYAESCSIQNLPTTSEVSLEPNTSVFPEDTCEFVFLNFNLHYNFNYKGYDPTKSDVDDSDEDPTYVNSESESEHLNLNPDINKKKNLRRKRKCPDECKQNVRKMKRNSGEEYLTVKGNMRKERKPKESCVDCFYKCRNKIDEEAKLKIVTEFWNMKEIERQRDYIATRVQRIETLDSRLEHNRRKFTNVYSLSYLYNTFRVCKRFFLSTLDISEKMMRTALNKKIRSQSAVPSPDKRGRHPPSIKLPEETMKYLEEHISSFPTVPSHWCRKDTNKIYLESILNKEKMYSLYIQFCKEKSIKPASKTTYKEALIRKNIGFYIPRKDQCWCYEFEHKTADEKTPQTEENYNLHIKRKDAANNNKKEDAIRAKNDSSFLTCNFDLEAVLYCPLYFAKPIFYKRKLAVYNFTIYEVAKKKGFCFLWDETQGNRGANEIATCVAKYISNISENVTHLTMYCDNCPGQNRNSIIVGMIRNSLLQHNSLETIEIKFLEVGHTHMECDSMHSTIESASKHAKVFLPSDWDNIIMLAKQRGTPYTVHELTYHSFKDYRKYKDAIMPNCNFATDGSTLNWKMVRCIKFTKTNPNILYFKNEYWDENYKQLDIQYGKRGRKPKLPIQDADLQALYCAPQKIFCAKYKDLINLCSTDVIPNVYHEFYKNLPHVTKNNDLPDSSSEDEIETQVMREKMKRRI